ncbi:MAG: hypothetical protein H0U87_04750 [Acidobacteria bacterium]|nr:hypothetical protein [Acidobacteriota bacterium]
MIQCQNCGRTSNFGNNFCRFCGTKFLVNQVSKIESFEQQPPRPYAWKTDEFQIADDQPKPKTTQINQVQPLGNQNPIFNPPPFQPPQPLAYQKPHPVASANYKTYCPRCAGQIFRAERKVSTAGWIVFAVLMVVFFPLFWIGLLIKEDVRICQNCNFRFV